MRRSRHAAAPSRTGGTVGNRPWIVPVGFAPRLTAELVEVPAEAFVGDPAVAATEAAGETPAPSGVAASMPNMTRAAVGRASALVGGGEYAVLGLSGTLRIRPAGAAVTPLPAGGGHAERGTA